MTSAISFARGAPSLDIVDIEGLRESADEAFRSDPGGMAAYGTSKRALLHMMQDLAVEWGQYGIRVNAVVPGTTRTEVAEAFHGGDLRDLDWV